MDWARRTGRKARAGRRRARGWCAGKGAGVRRSGRWGTGPGAGALGERECGWRADGRGRAWTGAGVRGLERTGAGAQGVHAQAVTRADERGQREGRGQQAAPGRARQGARGRAAGRQAGRGRRAGHGRPGRGLAQPVCAGWASWARLGFCAL